MEENTVLCGANAYEKKYYFNPDFGSLPQTIQDELHIMCVLFTEEIGGIFTVEFTPEEIWNFGQRRWRRTPCTMISAAL